MIVFVGLVAALLLGAAFGFLAFYNPGLSVQNDQLEQEVQFLRRKLRESERHWADLQLRLLDRDDVRAADWWKEESE